MNGIYPKQKKLKKQETRKIRNVECTVGLGDQRGEIMTYRLQRRSTSSRAGHVEPIVAGKSTSDQMEEN